MFSQIHRNQDNETSQVSSKFMEGKYQVFETTNKPDMFIECIVFFFKFITHYWAYIGLFESGYLYFSFFKIINIINIQKRLLSFKMFSGHYFNLLRFIVDSNKQSYTSVKHQINQFSVSIHCWQTLYVYLQHGKSVSLFQ